MSEPNSGRVVRTALILTGAIAAGWVVAFWPARYFRGTEGVWWMSVAAISCLIPGWIVVFLSRLAIFPNELVAWLVMTFVRLACVAGTALAVKYFWPELGLVDFFGWLCGFYFLTLFLEARFASRKRP